MAKKIIKERMENIMSGAIENLEKDGNLTPAIFVFNIEKNKKHIIVPILNLPEETDKKNLALFTIGSKVGEMKVKIDMIFMVSDVYMVITKKGEDMEKELDKYGRVSNMPSRTEAITIVGWMASGEKSFIVQPYERKDKKIVLDKKNKKVEIDDKNNIQSNLLSHFWKGYVKEYLNK